MKWPTDRVMPFYISTKILLLICLCFKYNSCVKLINYLFAFTLICFGHFMFRALIFASLRNHCSDLILLVWEFDQNIRDILLIRKALWWSFNVKKVGQFFLIQWLMFIMAYNYMSNQHCLSFKVCPMRNAI